MKKLIFIAVLSIIFLNNSFGQLEMDAAGDVKIGTISGAPNYKFEVYGKSFFTGGTTSNGMYLINAGTHAALRPKTTNTGYLGKSEAKFWVTYTNYLYYDNLIDFSDLSIKENVKDIDTPLSLLCQVRGVTYDLKQDYFKNTPQDNMDLAVASGKNKYGVIAQELKEIFPNMVMLNEETQLYGVKYMSFIPVLIEAIKEQQTQIEDLQQILAASNGTLKGAIVEGSSINEKGDEMGLTSLFQNHPNPFTEETIISYYLSEDTRSATLFVYDMTGKQLKNFKLSQKSSGEIVISGGELDAGLYMYSLVADGQLIGTKQMILTD